MRGFSFRSWLLVLALVVQTAAAGVGMAGRTAPMGGVAVSQHCANQTSDHGVPAGEHRHDCLSCPFCAASVLATPAAASAAYVLGARASVALGPQSEFFAPPASASARAHQPRAPPSLA